MAAGLTARTSAVRCRRKACIDGRSPLHCCSAAKHSCANRAVLQCESATHKAAVLTARQQHTLDSVASRLSVRAQATSGATPSGAAFGPRGVFLVGFTAKDSANVAAWFDSVEPGFPVSHCSSELLSRSLGEALYADYRDPMADLVKPSAAAGRDDSASSQHPAQPSSHADGNTSASPAAPETSASEGTEPGAASSAAGSTVPQGGHSNASDEAAASGSRESGGEGLTDAAGSSRRKSGGMQPVGSDPQQFLVHPYMGLLPMPRIAILSGLSEMEWVGICELWDTTGLPQPVFASVTQRMLTVPLGNLLDRIADEYARNDAVGVSGPPPSVIDVEQVRSKLEDVKARKAAAAAGNPSHGDASQQPVNQKQAAAARAALDRRLAASGGRLQAVDFIGGSARPSSGTTGHSGGQLSSATGQPQAGADAEAEADEERFLTLRRKAGKLARQERRAAIAKGGSPAQPRGFS